MNDPKKHDYLSLLNEPQRAAVLQTEGPVMIIAGAGSGKTRVLTYRIAHLLEKGVEPFNILSLTFTNKAAAEMRHRIEQVAGNEARSLWMGTFHSIFAKLLRFEADRLGYPSHFTIYDSDDSKSLIKTILNEMKLDDKVYKPGMVLARISNAKNNLITAGEYRGISELTDYDQASGRPKMAEIFQKYTDRCFRASAMDFDDLLLKTNELLHRFPEVLHKYQHKFKYLMVDEFQDTNHCQYAIIKKLAAVNQNICVVGDDAQSIYAFRGATIKNILNFEKDYPDLKVFKLEQNYRSTKVIVNAAGNIISNNREQLDKNVWTDNDTGEKIRVIRAVTDNEEGKIIAESIFEEKMRNRLSNKEFAILYRTNAQSRSFEEALRKLSIPYKIYGGLSFYQRKEIKDLIAYLRVTINPNDEEALKRIINYPARGIGKTTLDRLVLTASDHLMSIWEVIENLPQFPDLKAKGLAEFRIMIMSFRAMLNTHNAYDLAMHIARQTSLLKTLYEDKTVEGISRYENVVELLNGIKEFTEDDTSEREKTLASYLQDIALLTDNDKEDGDDDVVRLMTIHASKGLEFPHVYIVGLEENLFPSQMALGSRSDLEEERRLFYVAVTRAGTKLTLSFATSRFRFGSLTPCEPSRFIDEIDNAFLQMDRRVVNPSVNSGFNSNINRFNKSSESEGNRLGAQKPGFTRRVFSNPAAKVPIDPDFTPDDTSDLQVGMWIIHQRFGKGKVISIEGQGDSRKATVMFDAFGEKQLILKFAKIKLDREAMN